MISNLAADAAAFTSNAFLVSGDRTVLVDPGNEFDVVAPVRERVEDLDAVVVTHTHPDHVGNVPDVVEAFGVEVWGFDPAHELVDHGLSDGAVVALGDHDYEVVHTPGHKDDHVCLCARDPGVVFAGDLVFAGGRFGRTDLPEGDRSTLVDSIERLLDTVDADPGELHTGHGPSVTDDPCDHIERALRAARA